MLAVQWAAEVQSTIHVYTEVALQPPYKPNCYCPQMDHFVIDRVNDGG